MKTTFEVRRLRPGRQVRKVTGAEAARIAEAREQRRLQRTEAAREAARIEAARYRNCPFCGSNKVMTNASMNFVQCQVCQSSGPWVDTEAQIDEVAKERAIELWNARPTTKPVTKESEGK